MMGEKTELTGYPSVDRPWLQYYREGAEQEATKMPEDKPSGTWSRAGCSSIAKYLRSSTSDAASRGRSSSKWSTGGPGPLGP